VNWPDSEGFNVRIQRLNIQQISSQLNSLDLWHIDEMSAAISKEYVLRDFKQAFSFMTEIAKLAEENNHHPEWRNVYKQVDITWTTHDVGGLSLQDFNMARRCDEIYEKMMNS